MVIGYIYIYKGLERDVTKKEMRIAAHMKPGWFVASFPPGN